MYNRCSAYTKAKSNQNSIQSKRQVLTTSHLLSFAALCRGLDAICLRCDGAASAGADAKAHAAAEQATADKLVKRRYAAAADHFNRDVKKGLQFLQAAGLLTRPGAEAGPWPGALAADPPGNTHTLSLSHTHTHTHTLSLSHTHTLSLSHTHTLSHTRRNPPRIAGLLCGSSFVDPNGS